MKIRGRLFFLLSLVTVARGGESIMSSSLMRSKGDDDRRPRVSRRRLSARLLAKKRKKKNRRRKCRKKNTKANAKQDPRCGEKTWQDDIDRRLIPPSSSSLRKAERKLNKYLTSRGPDFMKNISLFALILAAQPTRTDDE